jgi:creatinine amidohydrolase
MVSFRHSTREISETDIETAIISVGATEQCGPYLPLHIDTLCAEYFARAWGEVLNAYVLPTLPFNTSEEHAPFKGTITLRPTTVMQVLEEIVAILRRQEFRKQVLTVGHGGSWWLGAFIKDMNWQYEDIVLVNAHSGADPIWYEALQKAGLAGRGELHGGAVSRALALYLAPESVSEGEYGRQVGEELVEYSGYMTWDKITPDGSWGQYSQADRSIATAEAGRTLLEYFVTHHGPRLKEHLEKACLLKGIPA